jgi:hypothetical protein
MTARAFWRGPFFLRLAEVLVRPSCELSREPEMLSVTRGA